MGEREKKVELQASFHGRVQGVFFRATTQREAKRLGLEGTVKNLPDGTVELFAVGEREALEALLAFLTGVEGPGEVTKVDKRFTQPNERFRGEFQVLY